MRISDWSSDVFSSDLLPAMDESNERWNLDEFRGEGNGVLEAPDMPGVNLLRKTMGSFAPELDDDYFDLAFSISVIEHIHYTALDDFWSDRARVLAPGRSEERRGGEECGCPCRSRWGTYQYNKKNS